MGEAIAALKEKKDKGQIEVGSVGAIRKQLAELLGSRVYQALKDTKDNIIIEYLQEVSLCMIKADATGVLEKYGKELQKEIQKEPQPATFNTCQELAKAIEAELEKPNFRRDSKFDVIWFAITHPDATFHTLDAKYNPLGYDSHCTNNADYHGFTLLQNKKNEPIQFYYGSCQTGDPIYEHGVIPAYRKRKLTEVRFNYQSTHCDDELARTEELHRIAEKSESDDKSDGKLVVVTLSFDTKVRSAEGKKLLGIVDSEKFIEQFHSKIKEEARKPLTEKDKKEHFGYYIPETALNKDQLEKTLNVSTDISKILLGSDHASNKETGLEATDPIRLKKMLMMSTDTVLSLAVLMNVRPDRCSGACKEDIDRGPPENLIMRIYAELKERPSVEDFKKWLKSEGATLVAGLVARGRHTDQQRNPMMSRAVILLDLLQSMGDEQLGAIKGQLEELALSFRAEPTMNQT